MHVWRHPGLLAWCMHHFKSRKAAELQHMATEYTCSSQQERSSAKRAGSMSKGGDACSPGLGRARRLHNVVAVLG